MEEAKIEGTEVVETPAVVELAEEEASSELPLEEAPVSEEVSEPETTDELPSLEPKVWLVGKTHEGHTVLSERLVTLGRFDYLEVELANKTTTLVRLDSLSE